MKIISFFVFRCNGAPGEWNWQGKTEVLGEKPVPVPLCPPQIPHGLTRDRTRFSAVTGRRLTACATARPYDMFNANRKHSLWSPELEQVPNNDLINRNLSECDCRWCRLYRDCTTVVITHVQRSTRTLAESITDTMTVTAVGSNRLSFGSYINERQPH
jgi:hypothetical protein